MSLAALREVYNPMVPKPELKPPLQDWKESVPVVLLSEYLKWKHIHGIKLIVIDGEPRLYFIPPLKPKEDNPERWEIAENAAGLFLDAIDDLKELISNGKLGLPSHDSQPIKKERVLPAPQNSYGSQNRNTSLLLV